LPRGDRQIASPVAKGTIRCNGCVLKSVCREVHGAALAASIQRVYRLRLNRRVRRAGAILDFGTLSARHWLTFHDPTRLARLAKAVTETEELFHAGAVSPKGCDDA
jgi:hypothetical protein